MRKKRDFKVVMIVFLVSIVAIASMGNYTTAKSVQSYEKKKKYTRKSMFFCVFRRFLVKMGRIYLSDIQFLVVMTAVESPCATMK